MLTEVAGRDTCRSVSRVRSRGVTSFEPKIASCQRGEVASCFRRVAGSTETKERPRRSTRSSKELYISGDIPAWQKRGAMSDRAQVGLSTKELPGSGKGGLA